MYARASATSAFVLPPSVTALIPWGGLIGVWYVWTMLTLKFPKVGEVQFFRVLGTSEFLLGTLIQVGFLVWLGLDLRRSAGSPRGLRRGHRAGLMLALAAVVGIQVLLWMAWTPVDLAGAGS